MEPNTDQMFSRPLKLAVLISILLSFSSLYNYFSIHILRLLHFYLNKNYVFLLSNGIIVFIFKSSGLIGKSSLKETDHLVPAPLMKTNLNEQNQQEFPESKSEKKTQIVETTSEEAKEMELGFSNPEEEKVISTVGDESLTPEGEEKIISIVGDQDEEQGKELKSVKEEKIISIVGDEDEEQGKELESLKEYGEDEDEEGELSAEELNKKCEDFIRKMKAAINFDHRLMQAEVRVSF